MQDGYWVVRTYTAGFVGEKSKYFIPGKRPDRLRRSDRRAVKKAEKGSAYVVKPLARLLNANCTKGKEWYMVGLDYSPAGLRKLKKWIEKQGFPMETEEERQNALLEAADHEMLLCIRRAKRKMAGELKAFYITSDMDGETGELVRVHHHLIINAGALEAFRESWKELGGVDYRHLNNQKDRTPIALYWMKQVRKRPDAKKYRTTRNLIRPQPKDIIAPSGAMLRAPKGCKVMYVQEFRMGGDQYIRYVKSSTSDGDKRQTPEKTSDCEKRRARL